MTISPARAIERERVLETYRNHLSVGLARLAELLHSGVETRSAGAYLWDDRDEKYLECGGFGVFLIGHCHPRVVEAVVDQVRTHPLSSRLLLNPALAEAAEALVKVAPRGLDHVYFGVSGAEAVETALKLGRMHGKRRLVAMENSYHGKTIGALSVTGREHYRKPFYPLLEDVDFVPFADADALAEALETGAEACVVVEAIQGEAGVIVPAAGYLKEVERLCREHGAFLVFDEIQTGLGRLGSWWGVDRESVTPDVVVAGKALSGGVVPVSAVLGTAEAFEPLSRDPLIHNTTFSGAPIAMAAAKATLAVIEEEHIVARAAAVGERVRAGIESILRETCASLVREVRGVGLLIAIEWEADYLAFDFLIEMLDRRVILAHSLNAPQVTRVAPPAIVEDEDVEWLLAAVRSSAEAIAAR